MPDFILKQYFIALLVTGIINGSLGIFLILKGFNKRLNRVLALYSLSLFLWSVFEALGITSSNESLALLLWRINHIGVIFIPIFLTHFTFVFFDIKGKKRKLIPISYAVACVFLILNATPLLISGVVPKFSFRYFINPGPLYYIFFWMWIGWAVYGNTELLREYFRSKGYRRNQIQYFCWSLLFSYIGGIPNFLPTFNIEIPILMPYGTYAIPLYVIATTYAILKYRFMDIKIAFTRVGIFAIVYTLVLGIPLGIAVLGNEWLRGMLGTGWYWLPFILAIILASVGPFIFTHLRRRTEDILLKNQRRYQRALTELSKTMGRIRDLNELVKAIAKEVVNTVKVSFAAVYLYSEDYKSYQLKECYPENEKGRFQELITPDYPLVNLLNRQKKPLLSEEIGDIDKIKLDGGLVIPCFIGDTLIAFLAIGSKDGHQMYTPDDVLAFEALSYSTALAIENSQFWKEIEERQRQARIAEMDLFSYSVAHEIDNPMSVIKGQVEIVRRAVRDSNLSKDKQKEINESLDFIDDAQDRTSTMVSAIEDYGKPTPVDLISLKLEDVINSFFMLYKSQFKHEGIYFEKETPERLPLIKGIKQELVQVMVNFANNSIHAVKGTLPGQEKTIKLKVEAPNSSLVRLSFSDNGYGIVKEKLQAVFAPFTTTKASTEGRGMGLSTVTKIIKKHKGRVWAESPGKGKGATMIIELPAAKDTGEEPSKEGPKSKRMF